MALTTGQVADEAGVDYQTVLFYEEEGLIDEPPRLDNGYRQYPHDAVRAIRFIRRAQKLGFTLREIEQLMQLEDARDASCEEVRRFASEKRDEIRRKIEEYRKLESVLDELIRTCVDSDVPGECPIMDALVEEDEQNGSGN